MTPSADGHVTAQAEPPPLAEAYGGFSLGNMHLALPMSALREVVRCEGLCALPCSAPSVIGGVNLRGVVVPVVDLRILLKKEPGEILHPCIIVMAHEGRLLGLLIERVTGIFSCPAKSFQRLSATEGSISVVAGTLLREEINAPVTVLSPELLATLPEVLLVDDPDRLLDTKSGQNGGTIFDARSMPVMLLRCQRIAIAIDAMMVHSTLANPTIAPSPLAIGACRGTIEYTGQRIPAVDLLALSGFGRLDTSRAIHAFVLQLDIGFVAFLVDEVIDVVRIPDQCIVPLAAYALPEPALFKGALPAAAVSAVFTGPADRAETMISQYLLIDTFALKACALVAALAATNVPIEAANDGRSGGGGKPLAPLRTMLTFDMLGECAAPLEQIVEILPYEPASALFDSGGALIGLAVNRGRSIPLFCLRRLADAQSAQPTAESRVLVVQCETECLGFVVERVRSIEPSYWNPTLPAHGAISAAGGTRVVRSRALTQVGSGDSQRMLRVVDLGAIALTLRHSNP